MLDILFQNYFRDPWNVFDLVLIIGSCADLIIYFNSVGSYLFIRSLLLFIILVGL